MNSPIFLSVLLCILMNTVDVHAFLVGNNYGGKILIDTKSKLGFKSCMNPILDPHDWTTCDCSFYSLFVTIKVYDLEDSETGEPLCAVRLPNSVCRTGIPVIVITHAGVCMFEDREHTNESDLEIGGKILVKTALSKFITGAATKILQDPNVLLGAITHAITPTSAAMIPLEAAVAYAMQRRDEVHQFFMLSRLPGIISSLATTLTPYLRSFLTHKHFGTILNCFKDIHAKYQRQTKIRDHIEKDEAFMARFYGLLKLDETIKKGHKRISLVQLNSFIRVISTELYDLLGIHHTEEYLKAIEYLQNTLSPFFKSRSAKISGIITIGISVDTRYLDDLHNEYLHLPVYLGGTCGKEEKDINLLRYNSDVVEEHLPPSPVSRIGSKVLVQLNDKIFDDNEFQDAREQFEDDDDIIVNTERQSAFEHVLDVDVDVDVDVDEHFETPRGDGEGGWTLDDEINELLANENGKSLSFLLREEQDRDQRGRLFYLDEYDRHYYLDDSGQPYYLDDSGRPYYLDDSGGPYYLDKYGQPYYLDEHGQPYYLDEEKQPYYLDELDRPYYLDKDGQPFSELEEVKNQRKVHHEKPRLRNFRHQRMIEI